MLQSDPDMAYELDEGALINSAASLRSCRVPQPFPIGTDDDTALHKAAINGHSACVDLLIRCGAPVRVVAQVNIPSCSNAQQVDPVGCSSRTPLHSAALEG